MLRPGDDLLRKAGRIQSIFAVLRLLSTELLAMA